MKTILTIILSYILGSIPFGLWIGLIFFKKDIRKYGSGNTGGTNTGRVLGKPIGLLTIILDALKGFIAMTIAKLLGLDDTLVCLAGVAAVLGHSCSVFLNFKGGKSVATWYGYLLGISIYIVHSPILFIISLTIFIISLYLSKMVSLSSMLSTFIGSILSVLIYPNHYVVSISLFILSLYIIFRHKENIVRIRNHTESKVKWI